MLAYVVVVVVPVLVSSSYSIIHEVQNVAGAVSFVLYRRRFLNKPQTLNDKCSNPDSSGYIDDSTLRVSARISTQNETKYKVLS